MQILAAKILQWYYVINDFFLHIKKSLVFPNKFISSLKHSQYFFRHYFFKQNQDTTLLYWKWNQLQQDLRDFLQIRVQINNSFFPEIKVTDSERPQGRSFTDSSLSYGRSSSLWIKTHICSKLFLLYRRTHPRLTSFITVHAGLS